MFVFGALLTIGSMIWMVGMYAWAFWDRSADFGEKRREDWRPVRYVSPRYLGMAAVGMIVGIALVVATGR